MSKLDVSPDLQLPEDTATRANALLAMKGAGKSNAAVVMAEEMIAAGIPWVTIDPKGDWWGIRASATGRADGGLAVPIFGGLHADVPLEAVHGERMADLIVDNHLTCLIDVSEMTKADSIRFLTAFFDRLYRRKSKSPYPMHLFLEECDDYVPQRVYAAVAALVRQVELVVKRGRQRGLGITLATQRSASVNKDVLTQTDNLIALRTTSPQDRKAIKEWIDYHASAKEIIDELPGLVDGEAWVSSPEHLRMLAKIRFRRRHTFDSGATPQLGEKVKPATLADIDVAAISSAFADTIEKARADDPGRLKKRIAELERELRERPTEPVIETVVEVVERPALIPELVDEFRSTAARLVHLGEGIQTSLGAWIAMEDRHGREDVPRAGAAGGGARAVADRPGPGRAPQRPDPPARREPSRAPVPRAEAPIGDLGAGEAKVLTAAAQYAAGVTTEQLSVLTGYKRSSRNTYVQRLRSRGLVTTDGGIIRATEDGLAALGDDFEPLPTGAALRDHWLAELTGGEQVIFGELVEAYPAGIDLEYLSETTGYKRSSRNTYLQRLRARQLVTTNSGGARAADMLFEDR